jgi:uncharacterized repeat protein (TIGR03803 family)
MKEVRYRSLRAEILNDLQLDLGVLLDLRVRAFGSQTAAKAKFRRRSQKQPDLFMKASEGFRAVLCFCLMTGLPSWAQPTVSITPLFSFSNGAQSTNGYWPENPLIQGTDGNFYGSTRFGGANGYGTLFKMTPDGVLTSLHSFNHGDGDWPFGPLMQSADGGLYGITYDGGASGMGWGTILKMDTNGVYTNLLIFSGPVDSPNSALGYFPICLFLSSDGNFYGTTDGGNLPDTSGSIFRMTPSGEIDVLWTFGGYQNEPGRVYALTETGDGYLYGTSAVGPTNCCSMGTLLRISKSPGNQPTVLANFSDSGGVNGTGPQSLVVAADGNFYGMAIYGGATGSGTIFSMTPDGTLSLVYTFIEHPTGFIQATDGNFYGTTYGGTIFRLTPSGDFKVLYSLTSTNVCGNVPWGGITQGKDGSFYGTTEQGGVNGGGTIFKMTVSGADAPWIQSVNTSSGATTLKWLALKGRNYQLQYSSDLSGSWTNVGSSIIATSQVMTASETSSPTDQRFYRIALLP